MAVLQSRLTAKSGYGTVHVRVPASEWQALFGRLLCTHVEPVPLAALGVMPITVWVLLVCVVPESLFLLGP